ncbi:hypothetical protein RHMOL_Rhmol11G0085500 [Rhododendron molle]|uniref:Uncharacterized protein n=1 Tax=Rhododendron molle TaxID=49168 RepID=A0ACC0LQU5_RHOML|nr:hypothetical protein RHMOL_Rhmol11G0085500 [Rhododendron molle]
MKVMVEAIPDGIISMHQNSMQTSVVGVIEHVSSSSPSTLLKVKCVGERLLPSIDRSSMSAGSSSSAVVATQKKPSIAAKLKLK